MSPPVKCLWPAMSLSEFELSQILVHCRQLFDASTQLNYLAVGRHRVAHGARREWDGEHADTFGLRMEQEAEDLVARSRELRDDAEAWAQVWADAVNEINQQWRETAVQRLRDERGFGEQLVDVFHGDDSKDHVPTVQPVSVPTAQTRFAATGGLESF